MSGQGSWCDALVVQAVSDALNCVIDITESAVNFNETTIVNPTGSKKPQILYICHIGHLGEFHHVSTISMMEPKKELHCKKKESIKLGTATDENLKCSQNTMTALAYPYSDIADKKTIKMHLNPQAKSGIEKKQRVICNMNTVIQSFTTALNVALNIYVLAVISYGIGHLYNFTTVANISCVAKT